MLFPLLGPSYAPYGNRFTLAYYIVNRSAFLSRTGRNRGKSVSRLDVFLLVSSILRLCIESIGRSHW